MVGSDIEVDDLPGPPPPATLRAFAEQNTNELRNKARRFAKSRARCVRDAGQPVPADYASELVADALTSTWLGITRWDPQRCSLLAYIRIVIFDRTSKEIRRGRRFPHAPIHTAANDLSDGGQAVHMLQAGGSSIPVTLVGVVVRVVAELKVIARGDDHAQALLGCWHAEVIDRDDVIAHTGLPLTAYIAARRRLLSLSQQLPSDLRASALDLLRGAP
jgi:hypothetical protein